MDLVDHDGLVASFQRLSDGSFWVHETEVLERQQQRQAGQTFDTPIDCLCLFFLMSQNRNCQAFEANSVWFFCFGLHDFCIFLPSHLSDVEHHHPESMAVSSRLPKSLVRCSHHRRHGFERVVEGC